MRLAFVNYAYEASIPEAAALLDRYETLTGWAEAVREAGAEVVLVAQRFSDDADVERQGIRYALRRDGGPPVATWRTKPSALIAAIQSARPDLVHVNGLGFPAQLLQLRAALRAEPCLVVQDHAGVRPPPRRWWDIAGHVRRTRLRRGLAVADAFLFTARAQARSWQRAGLLDPAAPIFDVPESSTTLRPTGRDEARATTGVTGHPAVLWVGRLVANKDPLTVLDAIEHAARVVPDLRLAMVYHQDDLLPAVRARLARSDRLGSRVHLVGEVPRSLMAAYYSAADLFVLGSRTEGSCYALIEALACGCVPVVTDIPAFRALAAVAGPSAQLWTPGDAWTLARALVRCAHLDFPVARRTVRAGFEAHLSWPALGRRAVAAYEAVCRRRGATGGRGGYYRSRASIL